MPSSPLTRLGAVTTAAVTPLALAVADDTYVVEPGDTTSAIAETYDTTVAALVAANNLSAGGHLIYAGESLSIPSAHGSPATADTPHAPDADRPAPDARRIVVHTVRPGDTVTGLAVRYHAWTDEIVARNGLSSTAEIRVGQRLLIPVVLRGAAGGSSAEAGLPDLSHRHVRRVIERVAARYGVDPQVALAVSWQEAGWQQDHISSARAIGAMQVLPSTGRWIGTVVGRPLDLHRLRDNVTAGVVLLRELTAVAPLPRALAGYYQGLASVREHGMYDDTRQYVRNVLALKHRYERGHYPY